MLIIDVLCIWVEHETKDLKKGSVMNTVFIQIRCKPGKTYEVADEIALRETFAELHSTSGDYDLLLKLYIPDGQDTGRFINSYILDIEGIERTHTIMTFKAF